MDDNNTNAGCGGVGCLFQIAILTASWFVYGNFNGVLGIFALTVAVNFTAGLCGIIPLIGQGIYWYVASTIIMPSIVGGFGLAETWLTATVLGVGLLVSIFASFRTVASIVQGIAEA